MLSFVCFFASKSRITYNAYSAIKGKCWVFPFQDMPYNADTAFNIALDWLSIFFEGIHNLALSCGLLNYICAFFEDYYIFNLGSS
uniref:Uncharacterized protein n=1 Tax=Arundo donax TaxID=35708 RepID=A0A0A9FUF6_ARUDO